MKNLSTVYFKFCCRFFQRAPSWKRHVASWANPTMNCSRSAIFWPWFSQSCFVHAGDWLGYCGHMAWCWALIYGWLFVVGRKQSCFLVRVVQHVMELTRLGWWRWLLTCVLLPLLALVSVGGPCCQMPLTKSWGTSSIAMWVATEPRCEKHTTWCLGNLYPRIFREFGVKAPHIGAKTPWNFMGPFLCHFKQLIFSLSLLSACWRAASLLMCNSKMAENRPHQPSLLKPWALKSQKQRKFWRSWEMMAFCHLPQKLRRWWSDLQRLSSLLLKLRHLLKLQCLLLRGMTCLAQRLRKIVTPPRGLRCERCQSVSGLTLLKKQWPQMRLRHRKWRIQLWMRQLWSQLSQVGQSLTDLWPKAFRRGQDQLQTSCVGTFFSVLSSVSCYLLAGRSELCCGAKTFCAEPRVWMWRPVMMRLRTASGW